MQILSRRTIGTLVGIAVSVGVSFSSAQSVDPAIGTWTLDVAKSVYKPGPPPKSSTLTIAPAGKGLKVSVDSVLGDGAPLKWGFTTLRDGKEEAAVTGNPMFDVVTSTRKGDNAGTNVYKKAGKVVMTTNLEISPDGKRMTLTNTGTDPKGQAMHNVAVYTK